jgi:curli biogenesis system outer membrane secretion channel CsgG
MKTHYSRFVISTAVAILAILPFSESRAQLGGLFDGLVKTKTEDGNADMQPQLGEYKGLKHAIGVVDFENQAGYRSEWKIGYNLGIMLESALFDSGRFIIVERENLGAVMAEQDLQTSGRSAAAKNVANTGKLRSAKYLATGAITEVDEKQAGAGGGLRIKGFKIGGTGGSAQITTIVKLIDTTSGEIVAKQRIVGKAGKKGLTIGYGERDWGVDLGGFIKTPLGEAAQDVINQAVVFLAHEVEDYDFTGAVVLVDPQKRVIINRGSEFGVAPGQQFTVLTEGQELIDPGTGAVLGKSEGAVVGRIEVTKADEKIAYCKIVEGDKIERGNVVKASGKIQ